MATFVFQFYNHPFLPGGSLGDIHYTIFTNASSYSTFSRQGSQAHQQVLEKQVQQAVQMINTLADEKNATTSSKQGTRTYFVYPYET